MHGISDEPDETGQAKKQKLGPSISFANVLADMGKEEAEAGTEVKSWRRPTVSIDTINPERPIGASGSYDGYTLVMAANHDIP